MMISKQDKKGEIKKKFSIIKLQLWTKIRLSSTIKFLPSVGLQRSQSSYLAFEVTKTPLPVIKEFIYNLVSLCLFPLNQQAFQGLGI